MDDQEIDDLSRALAASGTRRRTFGALAGLFGSSLFAKQDAEGTSTQKRRRQRRRKRKDRRKSARSKANGRGIKLTVGNPLTNPNAIGFEFGFGTGGASTTCCQGQAAGLLDPGEQREFTTASDRAYLWVENHFFIDVFNPVVTLPGVSWAIDGATYHYDPKCCKPLGKTQDDGYRLAVNEMKEMSFNTRVITIVRLEDEPKYKSFAIVL